MIVTRRHILIAASAGATAAFASRMTSCNDAGSIANAGLVPHGMDALLLHDGSATALAFARELRASRLSTRVSEAAVRMLTMQGFSGVGALLDGSRGQALLSLLDDGDSIVMEALLKARGAHDLVRRRHGPRALLTAIL